MIYMYIFRGIGIIWMECLMYFTYFSAILWRTSFMMRRKPELRRNHRESTLNFLCVFVLFLVYPMLPVSLDCPFWITTSVLSNFNLRSVLLVGKTCIQEENHRHAARNWQTFITLCCIQYTSSWAGFEVTTLVVLGTDCTCSCQSNYQTITTTTASSLFGQ